MVDLHSHILPAFDDGAKSEEETLAMGKIAVLEGITTMVATPHYIEEAMYSGKNDLLEKLRRVNALFQREGIDLTVLPGNEAYLSPELPSKLATGEVLTLNNTSYLLVELPMGEVPIYTEDILYELRIMGYRPVIAHPERYKKIMEDPNLLKKWIEQGNYAQINSGSITGGLGEKIQQTAKILLEHHMVHFIGTDAHSPRNRAPKISKAVEVMEGWIGKEDTWKILQNCQLAIEGRKVEIKAPMTYQPKKTLGAFFENFFVFKQKKAY